MPHVMQVRERDLQVPVGKAVAVQVLQASQDLLGYGHNERLIHSICVLRKQLRHLGISRLNIHLYQCGCIFSFYQATS